MTSEAGRRSCTGVPFTGETSSYEVPQAGLPGNGGARRFRLRSPGRRLFRFSNTVFRYSTPLSLRQGCTCHECGNSEVVVNEEAWEGGEGVSLGAGLSRISPWKPTQPRLVGPAGAGCLEPREHRLFGTGVPMA